MSVYLQDELWVIVQESERPNAPCPRPLSSGFSKGKAYRVLGLHCPSETSEAYFILCNDRKELWFVSNQHFRIEGGEAYSRPAIQRGDDFDISHVPLEVARSSNGHPKS